MVSHCTPFKDKVPVDAHVPGESDLGKQQMPVENGLGSTTCSPLVSSQVSQYVTANADRVGENYQGRQPAEEQNGSCLPPVSPFISDKHSQYASADADTPHRIQCKQQTLEGNDFYDTMSSLFTSDGGCIKQLTAEENGACLNQLQPLTPENVIPNARVGVDISHESGHGKEHAPDDSGFCVTPISIFSSHQGPQSPSVNIGVSLEADHGKTQTSNGNALCLTPVSPFTRGQGLPYAPEDMPCPGDTWSWRVGRRINGKGFFNDRYLRPPEHLRTSDIRPEGFGSKVAVKKYVLSELPQVDLDEFFSSFSWLVPAEEPMFGNQVQLLQHNICHSADTENSKEKNHRGGVPSDVPVHSISRKRKRKPVDYGFLLTKFSQSKSKKGKGNNRQPVEATLFISKKRKHEGRMWSDALKFYSRRPKIQLLIMSETEETSHGTHGEQRSKASLMEVQSNRQSCGLRSDKDLPCTETPELMIDASFNEDSGSINEQMRSAANTESNQVSSHNICTDLVLFQSPSYEDTVACKANVKDDNHESSAETVDIDQYINSMEDVHAQFNQDMRTIANPESYQVSRHNICADLIPLPTPFCKNSVACKASVKDGSNESSAETVNFDQYINSLDDLLAQPVVSGSTSVDTPEDLSPEKEMEEARAKLSSFFAVDFSVFVSSSMHFEFANVLGVLSKDPNLTTDQLVQLKLLEVIPLLRTRYLKKAKAIEEANNFFEDLSNKVAKVYSCKDEYNDFKKKEELIQEEIDSNSLHLKKIEERIALLLSQRDEVADTISDLKVQRNSLNSQKKDIIEIFLPDMVSRIQMANSKKVEWGSKKQKALERQAELKAVFVSIKDDILNRFSCKTT